MSQFRKTVSLFISLPKWRLGLALCLALLVHASLVASGLLVFELFSTPSDTNRPLALTLVSTVDEGLKETKVTERETRNDAPRKEEAAPKEKTVVEQVVQPLPEIASKLSRNNNTQALAEETPAPEPFVELSMPLNEAVSPENSTSEIAKSDRPFIRDLSAGQLELIKAIDSEINFQEISTLTDPTVSERAVTKREQRLLNNKLQSLIRKLKDLDWTQRNASWQHRGDVYTANVRRVSAPSELETDQITVDVVTKRDGKQLTTSLRLKQLAFSNFAQFVDRWDKGVSIHDDEFNGRFHSNSQVSIETDRRSAPRFLAKMTTAARGVNYQGSVRRSKVFQNGLETGVKRIKMPRPSSLLDDPPFEPDQHILIHEDARLMFQGDGSVLWQALNTAQPMRRYFLGERPMYFFAAPGVKLRLRGDVNGLVAVFSDNDILIESDIKYQNRAPIDRGGDFLGLVSGRSVAIAEREVTGTGDLHIDAAIYAKGRFKVTNLRGQRSGTLSIFGSLTSGSITATEPRYATRIDFDPRLERFRPPSFPVTDRYEITAQDAHWQTVPLTYEQEQSPVPNN